MKTREEIEEAIGVLIASSECYHPRPETFELLQRASVLAWVLGENRQWAAPFEHLIARLTARLDQLDAEARDSEILP